MYDVITKSRRFFLRNQVESLEEIVGVLDVVGSFCGFALDDVVVEVTCSFGWTSESS